MFFSAHSQTPQNASANVRPNAGIMKAETLMASDLDTVEATVATNLLGPIRLTAAVLPHLSAQPAATVMTVSSGLAFVPLTATPGSNTAHFAHLGGLAGAFLYLRWIETTQGHAHFTRRCSHRVIGRCREVRQNFPFGNPTDTFSIAARGTPVRS